MAQACAFWRQGMTEHPKDDRLADSLKRDCAPTQPAAASFKKLGEQLRNKPADDRPDDDDLTSYISRQYTRIKALNEKAIALTKALDRVDGMADAYAQMGEFYTSSGEYKQAQAVIGEALALNKALQRNKQLAANYRALAAARSREPDQAATLLKQAIALDESLGLTKELAEDYERLGDISKSRGEPQEAVRLYKRALALTPRKEDQEFLLRALGRVYRDLNDPGLVGQMEAEASAADEARLADGGGRIIYVSTGLGMWMSSLAAKTQVESLEKAVPMEKADARQHGEPGGLQGARQRSRRRAAGGVQDRHAGETPGSMGIDRAGR
jgi:tetratricopeptide (TPR) repeat protein